MKSLLLLFFGSIFSVSLCAQLSNGPTRSNGDQSGKSFKERLYFGGNLGLSIGTNTLIQVNPLVGYRVTDRYSVGLGPNYTYYKVGPFEQHIYGGSIFNRFIVFENAFAQVEFEQLYYQVERVGFEEKFKSDFPALLVGGGIRQPVGNSAAMTLTVQYDVLQDENSIYGNDLIIRGGIAVGF